MRIIFACILVLSVTFCAAHDYYILPEHFLLKKGEWLKAHLYVGDEFKIEEERGFQKYITLQYNWYQNGRSTDLLQTYKDSTLPFLNRQTSNEGLVLVSTSRNYARISMTYDKFTAYLKEEHLNDILKYRSGQPLKATEREKYTRYLKTLVRVGTADGAEYKKIIGQQLEIVLSDNPYKKVPGGISSATVLFNGKPLVGASVEVIVKERNDEITVTQHTTDKDGKLKFALHKKGVYLIRITHMISSKDADADWESFWSSYTFSNEE